jgi:glycine cleavage system H protein
LAFPDDVRYTAEHEWARLEQGTVTIGVTSYATDQLGDVVFIEMPQVGAKLEAMKAFGVIEAVKTVSDLFAPVSGEVVERNEALADNPALVNQDPFGAGWIVRLRPSDPGEHAKLMSSAEYEKHVEEQHA